MIPFILASIVSFIPSVALYLWLKNRIKDDEEYKTLCGKALGYGALSIIPITGFSAVSTILINLTGIKESAPLLYEALHTFIVLALSEELMKYLMFKNLLKKNPYPYSWLDVTVLMTIIATGFGMLESIICLFSANVPIVLVRGITVPHAGYGFIIGYFFGKAMKTGKKYYVWIGFGLAWFMHGLYDFSLSKEFVAISEYLMLISFLIAILDIVLVIMLILFARKAKRNEIYTEALELQ